MIHPHSIEPSGGPMSVLSTNQLPIHRGQQLRRAVYIHVADLIGTYSIDSALLEEEMARVKALRENPLADEGRLFGGVPTELDTSSKKRLQPPRGGYNMVALVGKVRIVVDKNRVDGSRVRLAEVEIGDATGTVSLRARDDQIDILQGIADRSGAVVLRNTTLELYQGKHIRLAVTKWGKISAYPDHVPSTPVPPSVLNRDRNFSMINLSVVANEMPSKDYQTGGQNQDIDAMTQSSTGSPANRNYQSNHPRGRERRPSRTTAPSSSNVPQHSYPGGDTNLSNTMRQYQGVPHGYATGFVSDPMGVQQYYTPQRHQEPNQQQQQQIMYQQHQYEMQQRQMHLYHRSSPIVSSQFPQSSMQIPGISQVSSFEAGSPGTAYASTPPASSLGALGHLPSRHDTQSPPGMNVQAATYDPNTGSHSGSHPR